MTKKLGLLLVGIWFVVTGVNHFIGLSFSGLGAVMALLAVVGGVLLIADR